MRELPSFIKHIYGDRWYKNTITGKWIFVDNLEKEIKKFRAKSENKKHEK